MRPTEGISVLKHVRNLYFPLMWADETATIDEESANLYKSKATIPLHINLWESSINWKEKPEHYLRFIRKMKKVIYNHYHILQQVIVSVSNVQKKY